MTSLGLAVHASGMVTGVGLSALSSCAAIRSGIDGFRATRFRFDGEWMRGSEPPLPGRPRGRPRWLMMARMAVTECLEQLGSPAWPDIPVLLCLPQPTRVGLFPACDESILEDLRRSISLAPDDQAAKHVFRAGRVGVVDATVCAAELIQAGHPACIVAGIDSCLAAGLLSSLHDRGRLLTARSQDGLLPGEACAAVLLTRPGRADGRLHVLGVGRGFEHAHVDSGLPLRAEGLSQAIRSAFASSGVTYAEIDYRLADVSGEQYGFREAALALSRTMRTLKSEFDIWLPAESVGEVGAAVGPLLLGVAFMASRKGYAPGPGVLCHLGNDDGARAAIVLRGEGSESHG